MQPLSRKFPPTSQPLMCQPGRGCPPVSVMVMDVMWMGPCDKEHLENGAEPGTVSGLELPPEPSSKPTHGAKPSLYLSFLMPALLPNVWANTSHRDLSPGRKELMVRIRETGSKANLTRLLTT